MNTKMKTRLLSLLLCFVMLVGLMPTSVFAKSGTGTQQDPVIVSTFAELKEALEEDKDTWIVVNQFNNGSYYTLISGDDYTQTSLDQSAYECGAINIPTGKNKHLTINTTIDCRTASTQSGSLLYSFINNRGNLTIDGTGTIAVSFNAGNYANAIIFNQGELNIDAPITLDATCKTVQTFGRAILNHTGTFNISDGTYIGFKSKYLGTSGNVGAIYNSNTDDNDQSVISGGLFETFDEDGRLNLSYALLNGGVDNLTLKGGTFYGIYASQFSLKLSALLGTGCRYTYKNGGGEYDGSDAAETTAALVVENNNLIPTVELTVTTPVAGNNPVSPAVDTFYVTIYAYEWYKGNDKITVSDTFEGGQNYTLKVRANTTKEFPNDVVVKVNGENATVLTVDNNNTSVLFEKSFAVPVSGYTLSFDASGGSGSMAPLTNAMSYTLPDCTFTAPSGKQFAGWNVFGTIYDVGDIVYLSANTTAYAEWEDVQPSGYTLTFDANGGSGSMAPLTGQTSYTLPDCTFTAPSGKQFAGWNVFGYTQEAGDTVNLSSNMTAQAVWENIPVTYYTVTFDSNGGSAVTAQTIEEGQKATKPADPTKAYYAFDGWYSDSNLTQAFDFNTPITGDITLYAKWDVVITAANATVTVPVAGEHPDFNPISGDSSRYTVAFETWYLHESPYPDLDANSVFEHGKYYSLRIRFTPNAGYQFDSNTVFTVNGKATASFGGIGAREYSATAYAATYTVTYDANGGTGSMAQEFLTHDNDGFAKNYTFPQCGFTSPAGQEFDKWLWYYESNPGSTNEITPGQSPWIYGNIVVKALWKTAEYNVTVTGGTASVGAGTPITKATMGTTVTLIAGQAPAGQEFDKWVVNGVVVADANSATTTFVMPAGNVTATATYKNISVGNHPVTIAMKDGDDVNFAYTDVQNLALELLAYKGLLVADAQVTGFRNNAGKLLFTMNNNFIVLQDGLTEQDYIHYTLTPQEVAEIKSYYGADITEVHLTFPSKCVVSFETNGGSSVSKLNLYIGDKVTKPADPTKPYFALAGWYSDSGLTQAFDFNQPITGDITLYAKWTPSPVGGMFLMTIDFNGGTSTMPTVGEVPANSGIYLNDNLGNFVTPPSGKVLAGYEIDGVPYAAGGDYLVTQNFTLKFLWKDAPVTTYTVSFNANGGTGTMADVTGVSGDYTLPSNGFTAPDGKQFKAWSVGGVDKAVDDKITVTADTTVTAVWETIPAGHTCDIKPVAKVEPSCTEGGKEAYYKCEGCGKFYEDALGAKEITDLAAWGNIAKNGHTESDWKSDKDNHWKECTVAACGVIIENSKAAHADANNDGKCDTCEYNVGTTTTNPNNKPSGDVQSPQTGDNSMMWLWVALLFVSGFGVVATTVIGKKKSSAK